MVDPTLAAVSDFTVFSEVDLLIFSRAPELPVSVAISPDGIAGEPIESFTITSMDPDNPASSDAMFLFRDSTIEILDIDGNCDQ